MNQSILIPDAVTLNVLGLSSQDFMLYNFLLKNPDLKISKISEQLKLPRSTIHEMVERLYIKGLAQYRIENGKRLLKACSPEVLNKILESKRELVTAQLDQIEERSQAVKNIVANMKSLDSSSKSDNSYEVKIYEGASQVKKVYYLILEQSEILTYPNAPLIDKLIPEIKKRYNSKLKNGAFTLKAILLQDRNGRDLVEMSKKFKGFQYRYLPEVKKINNLDYTIFENHVAIISAHKKPKAVLIKDHFLYNHSKAVFESLWDSLD